MRSGNQKPEASIENIEMKMMMKLTFFVLMLFWSISNRAEAAKLLIDEFVQPQSPTPFTHTATLAEIEPGVTLAAWVGGPEARHPENAIFLARRDQNGWGKATQVCKHDAASWNPVLWKDNQSGQLLMFYKVGVSPENWSGLLKRSNDGGRTWSEPEMLPAGLTGAVRSKPLQLDDGTLLCGDSVEAWQNWACWVNVTRDAGKSWTRHGPIVFPGEPYGIIQPTIFWADEKQTTLRMLMRATMNIGKITTATSTDRGRTWSTPETLDIENPNSALDAVRLRDGRIALAHNRGTEGRGRLALSLSSDGGKTWKEHLRLKDEAQGDYMYPSIIEDSVGRVQMAYTWEKTNIRFVVIDVK